MSYSRWSTLLSRTPGEEPPPEIYDRWLSEAPRSADYTDWETWLAAYDAWKEPFLEANGLELTSWYIFHHVASAPTPDEQMLAVWSNNVEPKPMFQAPQLRQIGETDAWEQIPGYHAAPPPPPPPPGIPGVGGVSRRGAGAAEAARREARSRRRGRRRPPPATAGQPPSG